MDLINFRGCISVSYRSLHSFKSCQKGTSRRIYPIKIHAEPVCRRIAKGSTTKLKPASRPPKIKQPEGIHLVLVSASESTWNCSTCSLEIRCGDEDEAVGEIAHESPYPPIPTHTISLSFRTYTHLFANAGWLQTTSRPELGWVG